MNGTKASCGHVVIAVGAPGSYARALCELHPCEQCLEEERAAISALLRAHPQHGKRAISINMAIACRAIPQPIKDEYERVYARNYLFSGGTDRCSPMAMTWRQT